MSIKLNEIVIKAIHKVFDESTCDFSKWWQDDFETDYGFDTEEELREFNIVDLECVIHDWVYWVVDGFVLETLQELGITSSTPETESQEDIVAEIYEIVKNELLKKVCAEWKDPNARYWEIEFECNNSWSTSGIYSFFMKQEKRPNEADIKRAHGASPNAGGLGNIVRIIDITDECDALTDFYL